MNASQNTKSDSTFEQQIQSIPLSQRQRHAALQAASVAEAFVEMFTWDGGKADRPRADVFAKPNLKY